MFGSSFLLKPAFCWLFSVAGASCGLETEPGGPNVSSGPGLGTLESQASRTRAIAPNQAETFCVASLEVATTPCLAVGRASRLLAAASGCGSPHQLRAMTRTRKWVSCGCGYNWAWQRQVETGEDTHCSCCGRNWQKQLRKLQSSKEGKEGNSPRAVWDAGRAQSSPDSGRTSRKPRRKPSSRQGSTRLAHVARRLLPQT